MWFRLESTCIAKQVLPCLAELQVKSLNNHKLLVNFSLLNSYPATYKILIQFLCQRDECGTLTEVKRILHDTWIEAFPLKVHLFQLERPRDVHL